MSDTVLAQRAAHLDPVLTDLSSSWTERVLAKTGLRQAITNMPADIANVLNFLR
jgi:hypothetical protein